MKIYDFKANDIKGEEVELSQYKGKKILIVNTASACGFTPQYEGLENLYQANKDNLVILAFPCNQFGAQEKGSNEEIQQFCDLRFKTTFPLFSKIDVNGENTHPLFAYIKEALPGLMGSKKIKWNFTKFLFDSDGKPVKRYAPTDTPEKIAAELKASLK